MSDNGLLFSTCKSQSSDSALKILEAGYSQQTGDLSAGLLSRRDFFDRVAEAWEEEHSRLEADTRLAAILERFDLKPGQVVLDAGCGTGRLVSFILQRIGPEGRLVAVDISGRMLDIARQKYRFSNVTFCQADVCQLAVSEFFDRIICLCLFPHLPDRDKALREFRKYLKPGGQLIIAHTTSREEVNSFHARLPEPICHDLLPEKKEMMKLLQKTGFRFLEFEESDIYFLRAVPS